MSYAQKLANGRSRGSYTVHRGNEKRQYYGEHSDNQKRRMLENVAIENMSDEELRHASLEKAPNGCATEIAVKAQRILYERLHGWGR